MINKDNINEKFERDYAIRFYNMIVCEVIALAVIIYTFTRVIKGNK